MKRHIILYTAASLIFALGCVPNKSTDRDSNKQPNEGLQPPTIEDTLDSTELSTDKAKIPLPKNINKISGSQIRNYSNDIFNMPTLTLKPITKNNGNEQVKAIVVNTDIIKETIPDTIRLRLLNYSEEKIQTGLHHELMYWTRDNWKKIVYPQPIVTPDIGYSLASGQSSDFIIPLFPDQYSFQKGKYRVVKYYFKEKQQAPKKTLHAYAEFEIK